MTGAVTCSHVHGSKESRTVEFPDGPARYPAPQQCRYRALGYVPAKVRPVIAVKDPPRADLRERAPLGTQPNRLFSPLDRRTMAGDMFAERPCR